MSKICGKIAKPKNENIYTMKIGGPRYVCTKERDHEGDCGDWEFMLQVEHARRMRGESDES